MPNGFLLLKLLYKENNGIPTEHSDSYSRRGNIQGGIWYAQISQFIKRRRQLFKPLAVLPILSISPPEHAPVQPSSTMAFYVLTLWLSSIRKEYEMPFCRRYSAFRICVTATPSTSGLLSFKISKWLRRSNPLCSKKPPAERKTTAPSQVMDPESDSVEWTRFLDLLS